jgi:hypothetical protein
MTGNGNHTTYKKGDDWGTSPTNGFSIFWMIIEWRLRLDGDWMDIRWILRHPL